MNIDLSALPHDVETLQRMVRTLAAETAPPSLMRRRRSNGCG
jgi:hypothetical protein